MIHLQPLHDLIHEAIIPLEFLGVEALRSANFRITRSILSEFFHYFHLESCFGIHQELLRQRRLVADLLLDKEEDFVCLQLLYYHGCFLFFFLV